MLFRSCVDIIDFIQVALYHGQVFTRIASSQLTMGELVISFLKEFIIGGTIGYLMGKGSVWLGLRGSVPLVFATYPLLAGIPRADLIFNLVFFISVTSVLLQGTTLSYVARLLHVTLPPGIKRRTGFDFELSDNIKA